MELKEFIKGVIYNINAALAETYKETAHYYEVAGRKDDSQGASKGNIDFDLAIIETKEKGGKIKVGIMNYVGAEGGKGSNVTESNRIKFSIRLTTVNELRDIGGFKSPFIKDAKE